MTEERRGGELTRRDEPRTEVAPRRDDKSLERFYAGDQAHTVGLTEERAATIVRQSGNARNIAFLATLVIVLFVPIYWFYDLGFPAVAGSSRLEKEKQAQQVTDVARGHELYLANCAQCHGQNGEGGIGPPLNDQNKLYNAVTPQGQPGTGHLNPNYLEAVLTEGGRYICGDPNSIMPVWADVNGGPLNYREIEELIAFLTASKDISWEHAPRHPEEGETLPPPQRVRCWRDPNYRPPQGTESPPPCWRDPDGIQIGANPSPGAGGAGGSPAAIENPGTPENPRVIKLEETATLEITDQNGREVTAIPVKAGETVRFEVTNTANFPHNFYIGEEAQLAANQTAGLEGIPDFNSGTQSFEYTFAEDAQGLQFACTVPGHYAPMHGDFQVQP